MFLCCYRKLVSAPRKDTLTGFRSATHRLTIWLHSFPFRQLFKGCPPVKGDFIKQLITKKPEVNSGFLSTLFVRALDVIFIYFLALLFQNVERISLHIDTTSHALSLDGLRTVHRTLARRSIKREL